MQEINRIGSTYRADNIQNKTKRNTVDNFSSFLGESKTLNDIFNKAAEKYDVPVNLLKAIGKAESNFKSDVVSSAGAQGVMQLMPATAKFLGVKDSFDPEQNIMGGARYISDMLKRYDGDVTLALAAYNAGSGNVRKYGGVPPFKETQNYIKKISEYLKDDDIDANIPVGQKVASTYQAENSVKKNKVQLWHENYQHLRVSNTNATARRTNLFSGTDLGFSYDDYLKFLETFLKESEDKEAMTMLNILR